ncbi:MAG: hypothetical protein IJT15_03770 [Rickettsiales bacterium]|nr:hypothetical protein [Rickettsiales bacterium]
MLTENIEYELDSQQKQVFDTIKNYIGIKIEKDNKKDEENKKEADNKNDNTIEDNITNQQSSTDLKAVNKRKWFGRYTDTDGHKYFSCCCFNIPLQ